MRRCPVRTVLTPWRIGAARPAARRPDRPVAGGEHDGVAVADRHRRRPRLGPRALLDDDELATGVVDRLAGRARRPPAAGRRARRTGRGAARSSRRGRSAASAASGGSARRRGTARATRRSRPAMAPARRASLPTRGRSATGVARTRRATRPRAAAADERSSGTRPRRSGGGPCRRWSGTAHRRRTGHASAAHSAASSSGPASARPAASRSAARRGQSSRSTRRAKRTVTRSRSSLAHRCASRASSLVFASTPPR